MSDDVEGSFGGGEPEPRAFRDAFGAFVTGVAVVTANGPDGPVGLTTNAVASVSLEPPLFLVSFATSSRTLTVVREAGVLGVSILQAAQQPMALAFASKHDYAEKFRGVALEDLGGVPVIAGASAAVVGTIEQFVSAGDHDIAICRCTALLHDHAAAEPLIFHRGEFGEIADESRDWPTPA